MTEKTERSDWDHFWATDSVHTKLSWSKRRIMRLLDQHVAENMMVLDAGCGSGYFVNYFLSRGAGAYALDYSQEALDLAKEVTKGRAEGYLQLDLLETDWVQQYANRFDIIFSDGLFEHFTSDERDQIFSNLLACLAPGGKLITIVPNRWSFWQVIRPFFMPGIKENPFTIRQLRGLYRRNGAKVDDSGGLNVLPFSVSPEIFASTLGMLLFVIGGRE